MRKITLPPSLNIPTWNRWRTECEKATQACLIIVALGQKPIFNKNLYRRKSIKKTYFFSKGAPFYGKCAYCETYISDFQHGDVEHFRPKGAVTDENDKLIFLKNELGAPVLDENNNPKPHPGYYWLAYDWRNLLPSCIKCNQASTIGDKKIGKHNRFPVVGTHAQKPEEIEDEQPLLINPASDDEQDDPEKHLTIDTATGLLGHLSKRGEMCIEIFGLNPRDQLVKDRQRACRKVRSLLVEFIYNPARRGEIRANLVAVRKGERSYTMAAQAVLAEFTELFNDD